MIYKIITMENFSQVEKVQAEMKALAKERFAKDGYSAQATEHIAFVGEDAIRAFAEQFKCIAIKFAPQIKTDGKTRARIIPYIFGRYSYYISQQGENGKFGEFIKWSGIESLIEFDGILFRGWDRIEQGKPCRLQIYNDDTDYYNYLPSDWEMKNPQPNKVGTITDKKMSQWKDWLLARQKSANDKKMEREGNVAKFFAEIAKIPSSECKTMEIGKNRGRIVRNGLCLRYSIQNGVVSTSIEVTLPVFSKESKVDVFNKMCEGIFVG